MKWLILLPLFFAGCVASKPKPPATPTPPPVTISAEELGAAYRENSVAADAKYKGSLLVVTGRFTEVVDRTTTLHIELWGAGSNRPTRCFFADRTAIDRIAELKPGDSVTVSGENVGMSETGFIGLRGCEIK